MNEKQLQNDTSQQVNYSVFHAAVLAIVAGFTDTVGFLSFGAFAGLMTGNTVLLGVSLAYGKWLKATHYLIIIASFLSGISISALLRELRVSVLVLIALEAAGLIAAAFLHPDFAPYVLALAMGLQNATVTRFAGIPLNTVFITGNLQRMVLTIVDRLTKKKTDSYNIATILVLWGGYLFGAVFGTQMHILSSHPLLFAPLLLPLVLIHKKKSNFS